jgi:hypothetical protein
MRYWKNFADLLISVAKKRSQENVPPAPVNPLQPAFFTETFCDGVGGPDQFGRQGAQRLSSLQNLSLRRETLGVDR